MTDRSPDDPKISLGLLPRILRSSQAESERAEQDRYLRDALQDELKIGQRISGVSRTAAVLIIALLLPFLNKTWGVLYYEALLVVFLAFGWVRQALMRRGIALREIWLILPEILLLLFVAAAPNPFLSGEMPWAFQFRFDNFDYFYLILALATLAYTWRTIWTATVTIAALWSAAAVLVAVFGHRMPGLTEQAMGSFGALHDGLAEYLDPNSVLPTIRVQEVVVFVLVGAILTLKTWRTNQLIARQAELAGERANLSRYFAPTVVEALARRDPGIGRARTHDVAVMFTDIVGFTEIAERRPHDEVLDLLRRYYAGIEKAVFDNGGTLDKYLGDGVMATFGTPLPGEQDAENALKAAMAVVAAIDAMDAAQPPGAPRIRVSVGLHFGPATIGNVGPSRRLEFAVIGDTVNVAKRLETVTRDLGCRIVASEALVTRAGVGEREGWRKAQGIALRGRAATVDARIWGEVA